MKKTIKQFATMLIICAAALQIVAAPMLTYAADPPAPAESKVDITPQTLNLSQYLTAPGQSYKVTPKGGKEVPITIGSYIVRLINFLSLAIGSFAFVVIVIGGITLLASAGSETVLQTGKDMIKFAIIGLVVALSAYYITSFVQSIFYEFG